MSLVRALAIVAVAWLGLGTRAIAGESLTVSIGGGREITIQATQGSGAVVMADLRLLARDLEILIDQRDDRVVIRDAAGAEWRTASGSLVLEGPATSRTLKSPAVVTATTLYLPLESIAELSGRALVLEKGRAFLLRAPPAAPVPDIRGPAGWQTLRIQKTAAEIAETQRVDGDQSAANDQRRIKENLPPGHEALAVDVGLGYAQGMSGAADVAASGTASGLQINFNTFVTYGRDGALYRSGRFSVRAPADRWWLEAGDLLSEVRGLARGVRVGKAVRSWWHPSVSIYSRSPGSSIADRPAVAYRDDLQVTRNVGLRAEAGSDRSAFLGARWLQGRASFDTFYRYTTGRAARDSGVTASYDVWHGLTAQVGARLSTGQLRDRWYFAAVTVPVANLASVTLERTRSIGVSDTATSAFGLQLPIGRLRIMQRYQWTDIGFLHDPVLTDLGHRQLQSMASYSPTRRVQLNYQVATQWYSSTAARQWTELQTVVSLSKSTSVHAVTGFPDVGNMQRFRFGLQQNLRRGFRLAVDYGALPAFQTSIEDRLEHSRFLVMVRRNLSMATPATGANLRGRVVDPQGEPIAGAVVSLGPYITTARADGAYEFAHVPAGDFDLALDETHLPAQYASEGVKQRLHAVAGQNTQVDLHVIPLHAIHGHVYLDRNGNNEFDPGEGVPNVVILLSQGGAATMTDNDGAYGFYNLLPGQYQVKVDVQRLSRELMPGSADVIDVGLEATGRARTGVDFRVAARQRPIVVQKMFPQ